MVPWRVYLVEATYEAFTVSTTAFIRFLAAWIRDVALSSCTHTHTHNSKRQVGAEGGQRGRRGRKGTAHTDPAHDELS